MTKVLGPATGRPTARELMVLRAAAEIRDGELVFVGMRLPLLAFAVAKKLHAPSAVGLYENGVIRDQPSDALLYTMSDPANIDGATRAGDMLEVMGLLQQGRVGLGFVGAAEVDAFGNLNTTRTGAVRLPGSGGACDIASLSKRLIVIVDHRPHRLVERVSYVTSPGFGPGGGWRDASGLSGGGPDAVITDLGVLRFPPPSHEAVLVSCHGESVEQAVAQTGWGLRVADGCRVTAACDPDALALLRTLDPDRFWLGAS